MTNYRITTAPVLIPNTPDCDFQNGETPLSTDQIQTLQQTYNQYQIIDYQHQFMNDGPHFLQRVGTPIKSWISTKSTTYTDVLGNTRTIPEGTWWLQSKITDPEMIKKIDQGKLTAYSLTTTAKNIADKYKSYMTSNKSSLKKDQVAELEQISRKYRTNINDIPDPVAFTVTLTDFPCVGGAVFSKKCLVNSQHGISTKMDDNMTTEDNKFSISDLKSIFNIFSSFKSEDKPVEEPKTEETPTQEQPSQDNTTDINAIVDGKIKVNNEELKSYFKETLKEIITDEKQKQEEKPSEPEEKPKEEQETSTKSNPQPQNKTKTTTTRQNNTYCEGQKFSKDEIYKAGQTLKKHINCDNINLKKGSTGEDVKELQTILARKGYYVGRIDGYYGDMTLNAVIRLQKAQGNTPDGWFGKKTCQKLHQNSGASKTVTKTSTNSNNCAGQKFSKTELYNAGQTLKKHIGNNNNYPNYITMKALDGIQYDVPRSIYMGLLEGRNLFAIRRGRLPNWVQANSTANNPLCFDHQNNAYNCGPTSLSMCMQMMGEYIPENQLAREAGTTRNGTGPAQLKAVARRHGYKLTEINRNSLAVKDSLSKCRPVLMHINTAYAGGRSCLGYIHRYGHYIMCYRLNSNNTYEICDPTKGFKTCKSTSIDNARSGEFMKYYSLSVD